MESGISEGLIQVNQTLRPSRAKLLSTPFGCVLHAALLLLISKTRRLRSRCHTDGFTNNLPFLCGRAAPHGVD